MSESLLFDLKVLEFKLKEAFILYENSKTGSSIELLKSIIHDLCSFIISKENQLKFFQSGDNEIAREYIVSIRDFSAKVLGIIEKEEARKILKDENSSFQYGEDLSFIVKQEIHDYEMKSDNNILFIGSGAMPITAFTIVKEIGARITCVDIDKEALKLSKEVSKKLGFHQIDFEENLSFVSIEKYSHVIIASLVPLKCNILEDLRMRSLETTKLILRYGNEIKELFNYPLCQKEIKAFVKTVIRDRDFIYDTLVLERE